MKRQLLRILIGFSIVLAAVAAMVLVGVGPTKESVAAVYPARMDVTSDVRSVVDAAPTPRHDADLPTAVIVMASEGVNAADALAPYEVLSVSEKFNVYTAAPERRPVPTTGGLDIVPDFSFDELTQQFPDGVDVVFAPDVPGAAGPGAAPVRDWLTLQYRSGATVVGVCTGGELLAEAGLLDGRRATSHWLGLYGLTRKYPDVKWQRDTRYVDDGNIITTAGVLSAIDGALRVLEREADQSVAQRAADAVGWTSYRPGSAAPVAGSRIRPADTVALLNVAYREPTHLGVLLTDGVGEIELASVFRPYSELSYVARPQTVTLDGSPIRSRHGLTFLPRSALGPVADQLDRLVVPGSDAAQAADPAVASAAEDAGLETEYLHTTDDVFPFDPVLQDIAETKDVATATWVAKTLEYPVKAELSGPAWPWSSTAKLALVGLVGAAVTFTIGFVVVRVLRARPGLRRFVGHYLEMVLSMLAGMGLLAIPWMVLWPGLSDHPVIDTLVMAANMTIGMAAWMVFRGHGRRMIVEMSAAMVAPFLLLLVPLAAGAITTDTLMMGGHTLMFITMLGAMLVRRDDYTHHHGTWPWRRSVPPTSFRGVTRRKQEPLTQTTVPSVTSTISATVPPGPPVLPAPSQVAAPDGAITFRRILVNTLLSSVTSTFLSFALTFWVYLETRSVLAASLLAGFSMLAGSASGLFFGPFVDGHRKKTSMVVSTVVTLAAFGGAAGVFVAAPARQLTDWSGVWFWTFAVLVLIGAIAGQLRSIALSTTVTLLIPEDRRDRANGMVGTVTGLAHMVTSVFSGLSVGILGMGGTVLIAVVLTGVVLVHLLPIGIDEPPVHRTVDHSVRSGPRTAWDSLRSVPGLMPLVFFSTFNNLVMGVYMTLMDPYGLTLFSVEAWGLVLGVVSVGFMVGGALVARFGLGRSPVRTLLLVNVMIALVGILSAFRDSQLLLVAGMFGFMLLIPIAEAAEQTIMQRLVPFEKQGRVFGFAQSVESASTPVAAFVVGPLAAFLLIPFMGTDAGRSSFGWLLGGGEGRGIALTFVAASSAMLVVVLLAFSSSAYRRLTGSYDRASEDPEPAVSV